MEIVHAIDNDACKLIRTVEKGMNGKVKNNGIQFLILKSDV
jgi:hypothetical protein